jgi:serine/threonine protein kinase
VDADPLIGQVVREYEVRAFLGGGGFGRVYRAVHRLMGVERALKVLHPQFALDPAARARFFREARTGDTLRHPNIVAVHEVFEHGGQFWTAMDLVVGGTLLGRLTEGGPLPVRELLPIARGVASGLDHAHEHGVIHCDIKPSNILLRRSDGMALVTDFGLARLASDRTQSMPNVAGMVPYMSPEQLGLNGASVGRASDVYSLTAVLYEMLTGEPPYGRGMEALSGHYGRYALRPVSGGRQSLPAALDGVLARGLSQDPAQRPASAGALVREVDALVADEPTRVGTIPVPLPPPPQASASAPPQPVQRKQRHGCLTAWLVLAIAVNSILTLVLLFGDGTTAAGIQPSQDWLLPVLATLSVANVTFAFAMVLWKKWGFYGFVVTTSIRIAIDLVLGISLVQALVGLLGIAVLYGVLQIGGTDKGWPQLE